MRATDVTYTGPSQVRKFTVEDLNTLGLTDATEDQEFPRHHAIRVPGKLAEVLLDPEGPFRQEFIQGEEELEETGGEEINLDESVATGVASSESSADSVSDPSTAKPSRKTPRSAATPS